MKATARGSGSASYRHEIQIRQHRLVVDEPPEDGGEDEGPTPQELLTASLAGCIAITMEMYARRKGWDIGSPAVTVELEAPAPGAPTRFRITLALPAVCTEEQQERLRVIATKCPIHRLLEGAVEFDERVTVLDPADG